MPTQKYRVDTDKGSYEVEVEMPESKSGDPGFVLPGGAGTAMLAGGKGFLKGLPAGIAKAIAAIPEAAIGLGVEALSTVADTASLLSRGSQDPTAYSEAINKAYDNVTGMPGEIAGQAKEFLSHMKTLAKDDPEAFGKTIGELTGQAEVGIAGAKLAPLGVRPLGRKVGAALEETGKLAKWPMRISGSHAVLGGNPAGIAMLAAPPLLERGGAKLKAFGEAEPKFMKAETEKFRGPKSPRASESSPSGINILPNEPDMWDRAKVAQAGEKTGAPTGGGPISPEDLARLRKQGYTPDVLAKIESAAGKSNAPLPMPPSSGMPPIRTAPKPMGGEPIPARTGGGMKQEPLKREPNIPMEAEVVQPHAPGYTKPYGRQVRPGESVKISRYGGPGPEGMAAINEATYGPGGVESIANVIDITPTHIETEFSGTPMEQQLLKREAKVPVEGNVPASKSKSGVPSATPGLTRADVESVGGNPDLKYTGATLSKLEELLSNRAGRSAAKRQGAGFFAGDLGMNVGPE